MYQYFGCVLCIVLVSFVVNGSEDFYKVLNINKDATSRELRKAFKKAALEFHPDKNKVSDFSPFIGMISAKVQSMNNTFECLPLSLTEIPNKTKQKQRAA